MRLPIIPKPLRRFKGQIFMSVTLTDLAIVGPVFIFVVVMWFLLDIPWWGRFAFTFILIVGALSLCIPIKNQKVYALMWRAFVFTFSKKHYSPKESSMLIPYKDFEDEGIIALKTGSYAKVFELTGFNIFILQDQEAQMRLESFRNVARASGYSFSIIKQNLPSSLEDQMDMIEKQIKKTKDSKIKKALEDNLGVLKSLEEKELNYVDKFFLILYGSKSTIDKFKLQVKNALENAFLFPVDASQAMCQTIINNFYKSIV